MKHLPINLEQDILMEIHSDLYWHGTAGGAGMIPMTTVYDDGDPDLVLVQCPAALSGPHPNLCTRRGQEIRQSLTMIREKIGLS